MHTTSRASRRGLAVAPVSPSHSPASPSARPPRQVRPAPAWSSARCTAAAATPARPSPTTSSSSTTRRPRRSARRHVGAVPQLGGTAAAPASPPCPAACRPAVTTWSRRPRAPAARPPLPDARRDRHHRDVRHRRSRSGWPPAPPRSTRPPTGRTVRTGDRRPGRRQQQHVRDRQDRRPANATSRSPHRRRTPTTTRPTSRSAHPTPQNAGTVTRGADPDEPTEATIAEIQGTGDTSPLRRRHRHHRGRRHRGVPDRRLQRLLPRDRGRRHDPTPPAPPTRVFVYGSAVDRRGRGRRQRRGHRRRSASSRARPRSPACRRRRHRAADAARPSRRRRVPWSDLDTAAEKEAHEGELVQPQGDFTVTDNYDTNTTRRSTLAAGDKPLRAADRRRRRPGHRGDRGDRRRQRRAAIDPGRRREHQLQQRRQQVDPAAVALDDQPRAGRLGGRPSTSRWCSSTATACGTSSPPAR